MSKSGDRRGGAQRRMSRKIGVVEGERDIGGRSE